MMPGRATLVVSTLCFALTVATGELGAQTAAGGGAANQRAGRAQFPPQEVVRMLDAYAVVQAQDALQLTDAQYGPFVTRLKRLQETRRRLQQQRNSIVAELRRLTAEPGTDDNTFREKLAALRDHDDRAGLEMRKAYDAVDEVIDARQRARFRIFEETIERRKFDLLMRARQAARRGGSE